MHSGLTTRHACRPLGVATVTAAGAPSGDIVSQPTIHPPTLPSAPPERSYRPLRSPDAHHNDTRAAWVVGVGVLITVASAIGVVTSIGSQDPNDLASAVWSDDLMDDLAYRPADELTTLAQNVCQALDAGSAPSRVSTQLSRSEGLSSAASAAFVRTSVEYVCPSHAS